MTNSTRQLHNQRPEFIGVSSNPDFSEAPNPVKSTRSIRRLGRIASFLWDIDIFGEENIPMEGPAILAFSHRSYTEIFLQGIIVPRAMRAMMKQEVQSYPILGRYLAARGVFFVDREGPDKRKPYETAYNAIEEGYLLNMNPEGTSKNRGPKLGELKNGVAALAVRAAKNGIDCPIVPIGIASEHLWLKLAKFQRHLPVVIGQPLYARVEGKSVRDARKETHERLETSLQDVFDLALSIR